MKNIVVLVSGGGTNLQALIDAQKSGIIKGGRITCVISSKEGAYALERAKNNDIPSRTIPRKNYPDAKSYSLAIQALSLHRSILLPVPRLPLRLLTVPPLPVSLQATVR